MFFTVKPHLLVLGALFIILQLVAYFGVWWGLRAARRAAAREQKLPLQDR